MQITRQADYATRAVLHLARAPKDKLISTSDIARDERIPGSFLAKIIAQLSIAGLVQTSRGARGGVRLARKAGDISLLAVIEAIDGPIKLNICVDHQEKCAFEKKCPFQSVWCNAQVELVTRLRDANFDRLLRREKSEA